ncbi:MAG TPA: YceI family protein [Draconibacterium sp.]|nr:YceI family protein [Draconibacterium sp.]
MKQLSFLITGLLFCFSSFAQHTWTIDNAHSNIRFEAGWEGFSVRTGEFKVFEGTIETDSKYELADATFHLMVDPKSVEVIAEHLSEQVRGEQFLDAEQFPEITFNATGAKMLTDSTFVAQGELYIHGVKKQQEAHIWYKGHKQGGRAEMLALEVSLTLNRTDFGLDWGSPRLGETVKIVGYLLYQMRNTEE